MHVVDSFLSENILGRASAQICEHSGRLIFGSCLGEISNPFIFRVLGHVTSRRPWNYWNRVAFREALEVLRLDPKRTLDALHSHRHPIDIGVKEWLRDVPALQDEQSISFPDTDDLIRIATVHHPEYLRRSENILGNILHLYWGILKRKSVDGLFDLRSALALFSSKGRHALTAGYREEIRNAIAHGKAVFTGNGIQYGPPAANIELLASDLLHELDVLWETCNSIVLALIVFGLENLQDAETHHIPSRLAALYSDVAAGYPKFSIIHVVESDYPRTGRQLHLSISAFVRSRAALAYDCLRVSLCLWKFGARDYNRFIFNISHPGIRITSAFVVSPSTLASLAMENASLNRLPEAVLEPTLLWQDENSASLKFRIGIALIKSNIRLAQHTISTSLRKAGHPCTSTRYVVRSIEDRSVENLIRLEVTAVLVDENDATNSTLLRHIATQIIRRSRRRLHYSKPDGLSRKLPLVGRPKYVWVKLFRRDGTIRDIGHGGWFGSNLILTAERVFRSGGQPVFIPNPQEIWKSIRLRYELDQDAFTIAAREVQEVINEISSDPPA